MIAPPLQPPVRFPQGWKWRTRTYRTGSRVGLEPISESERSAARLWPFSYWGLRRFCERGYLDAFYRTIDGEYAGFASLPFPRTERSLVAPRVAASIRTIAAFSAWYRVAGTIVSSGFSIAATLAVIGTVAANVRLPLAMPGNVAAILSAIAISLLLFVVAAAGVAVLPHRWPGDALTLIFASAVFITIAQFGRLHAPFWLPGADAACFGVAVFFAVGALSLITGQLVAQRVTRRKITRYPEEEIIESIAFLLARIDRLGIHWRLPENRARIAVLLEWIARRFEQNLVQRYQDGSYGSDGAIGTAAAERGQAFRAQKLAIALPSAVSIDALQKFLWTSLLSAASNDWDALQRLPVAAPASKPARFRQFASSAAGIVVPILIAVAFAAFPWPKEHPEYDVLRNNVAVACIGWSVLSVLALLNPRQFEAQLSAAKTLGELVKKG